MKIPVICALLLVGLSGTAQSPYRIRLGTELAFTSVGLAATFLGAQFRSGVPIYSGDQLAALDAASINRFDRNTVHYYSLGAHQASNVFWITAMATPTLFLAGKKTRQSIGAVAVLWSETMFITSGLTLMTKYAVRRTRPFVYNPDVEVRKKRNANARGSFFSGHTSMSAASTFFAATVFSDYYPDSKWKPVIWGAAAAIPAVTGYLRVRGGRHFPTDVIVGYAVGSLVGWGVPALHRRKVLPEKMSMSAGPGGLSLVWLLR
ncbi:MAG: phosphatase PAP2 family protein [Saprospiraceae bacterium]|nr:phosphatase PAP2 family protein [Saprospiraceae bacterium]